MLKDTISISKAAQLFDIDIKKGRQACPVCGSGNSFVVKEDSFFTCYRCGIKGDVVQLLVTLGIADTIKEAASKLAKKTNTGLRTYQRSRRKETLKLAYDYFLHESKKLSEEIMPYIKRRWPVGDHAEIGYCPSQDYLQSRGLSLGDLIEAGLASENGWEFMSRRIVFPVYSGGQLVHMQGRAIDPDDSLRWVCTKGKPPITQYLYNADSLPEKMDYLILCEGISDGYSIKSLGLNVCSSFGINFSEKMLVSTIGSRAEIVIACFDSDRVAINGLDSSMEYKSWAVVLPTLVDFSAETGTPVYCYISKNTEQDINDMLLSLGYDEGKFEKHLERYSIPLPRLAYELNASRALVWKSLAVGYGPKEDEVRVIADSLMSEGYKSIARAFI